MKFKIDPRSISAKERILGNPYIYEVLILAE
jgi:hypothetical protein